VLSVNANAAQGTTRAGFSLLAGEDDRGHSEMQNNLDQGHFIAALADPIEEYH
jgi:hypothetical protein